MDDWFATLSSRPALPVDAAGELAEGGFVVLPGPILAEAMPRLRAAYDAAVASAAAADVGVGRASTRVSDFVNRGAAFDAVYTWPPALDACRRVIGRPFRLSAMHARTLRPGAAAQELHADVPRTSDAWPMLGLILMVDPFQADNGATRFVPGSHRWTETPDDVLADRFASHPKEGLACGPAGSVILFDASTWHGHTANMSDAPRRSLQATFIPREGRPATDFAARMGPETRARIDAVARYLVGV
jgi:ectoine hydroxylase-related dioxygenase (phytanoyl-CoA dioxygenase family)